VNPAFRTNRPATHPYAVIVDEALGAVLAPERRADVVLDALLIAGTTAIPSKPTSMRIFVEGALFSSLSRHLGVEIALEVTSQIRSALELALETDDRPRSDVRPRIRVEPAPKCALVVTQASLVVFLLQDMIGNEVDVMPINSEAELRDRLPKHGESVLVVIDRKHPCVDLTACNTLRRLGQSSTVVWWGAPALEHDALMKNLADGPRVVACELDLRLADLGELCRELLTAPPV
jgi:hypothetical protein